MSPPIYILLMLCLFCLYWSPISAADAPLVTDSSLQPEKIYEEAMTSGESSAGTKQDSDSSVAEPHAAFFSSQPLQEADDSGEGPNVPVLINGDFSRNTTGTPFPNGWENRIPEGTLPVYRSSYEGRTGVMDLSAGSRAVGLKQDIDPGFFLGDDAKIQIAFKIDLAFLEGDGWYGIEAPIRLYLIFENAEGKQIKRNKYFNYTHDDDSPNNPDFELVARDTWVTRTFTLGDFGVSPEYRLKTVEVRSCGWGRESYVDSIEVFVTPYLAINQGAPVTSTRDVILNIVAADNPVEMSYALNSWDPGAFSPWVPYQNGKAIQITGYEGMNYVNVRLRDSKGNVTYLWDSILLDRVAPAGNLVANGGYPVTGSRNVMLEIQATDAGGAGLADMCFAFNSLAEGDFSDWEPFSPAKEVRIPPYQGTNYINVKVRDQAGNVRLFWTPIQIEEILVLNSDIGYTVSQDIEMAVALLGGSNFAEMSYAFNSLDEEAFSDWTPFIQTTQIHLPGYQGRNYVNVRLKDTLGHVTYLWDSIILDQAPPEGTLVINNGAEYADSRTVSLRIDAGDIGSEIVDMSIAFNGLDESSFTPWEPFAADKEIQIPGYEGRNYVNVRLRDKVGNVTLLWASIYLQYDWPEVPQYYTRARSNPNFAYRFYAVGPHPDIVFFAWSVFDGTFYIGPNDGSKTPVDVSPDGNTIIRAKGSSGSSGPYYAFLQRTYDSNIYVRITLNAKLKSIVFNEDNTASLTAQNTSGPAYCYTVDLSDLTLIDAGLC